MTGFDMTESIAPKSDQQNFDDYIGGPKTVTVSEVRAGSDEQPVEIHLVEFPGRPFKPSKSMRRVLVAAWGPQASTYAGRRMTLVGDPTVRFGGAVVGGVRISHLSHIDKPLTVSLTTTRGKRAPFVVQPLADAPPATAGITAEQLAELGRLLKANDITDRDTGLAYVTQVVGRDVASSKSLTEDEATRVIASLTEPTIPGSDQ